MGERKKQALERFNRDNIITAAKELFEAHGVDHTTMDDIARQADYSKSTIYVYFKSKEEIYNSIVHDYMDMLTGELAIAITQEGSFSESYHRVCDCLVRFDERHPAYYAGLLGEAQMTGSRKKQDEATRGTIAPELEQLLVKLIEKGKKEKTLSTKVKSNQLAFYMWSGISGIIRLADRKKAEIVTQYQVTKDVYLSHAFSMFYESLIRG